MSKADVLLEELIEKLRNHDLVQAAWLSGSRGRGTNDEFSDIDIWIAVDDGIMPEIEQDPLSFVHLIAPTIMHMVAPEIAPEGGAFVGTWVSVDDEFVQVDWYVARASNASRPRESRMLVGNVPISDEEISPYLPSAYGTGPNTPHKSLALAMQRINYLVKRARRGNFWDAANSARNAAKTLILARSLIEAGSGLDYLDGKHELLPEPPPTTIREVQTLADLLLNEAQALSIAADANLDAALTAMRAVVHNWRATGWKPTEEYYRTLPRSYMGSGVLITDADNNILILETTYKDVHEIPGGVCEAGEAPRITAKREVQEELGINLQPGRLLVMDSRNQPAPKGNAVMFVYDGGVIEDPAIIQPDPKEIAQVKFVPLDRVDRYCTPQMALRLRTAMAARKRNHLIEIADGVVLD